MCLEVAAVRSRQKYKMLLIWNVPLQNCLRDIGYSHSSLTRVTFYNSVVSMVQGSHGSRRSTDVWVQNTKLCVGSLGLGPVFLQKAVFWIPIMESGINNASRYRGAAMSLKCSCICVTNEIQYIDQSFLIVSWIMCSSSGAHFFNCCSTLVNTSLIPVN
jgi:hypothetical protein